MKAGNTNYETGTRVRIANIADRNDLDLNGREGVLCRPFRQFPIQEVGIRIEAIECTPQRCPEIDRFTTIHNCLERSVTVRKNEFEVIG